MPLARIAKRVYAIDIDPAMLDRAQARVAAAGPTNCEFCRGGRHDRRQGRAGAGRLVFLANTFHGVSNQLGLARAGVGLLKPKGEFGIINWHRRPRDGTVVLGKPRGQAANDVAAIVKPADLLLNRTVEMPPYHYGVVFQRGGGNERRVIR